MPTTLSQADNTETGAAGRESFAAGMACGLLEPARVRQCIHGLGLAVLALLASACAEYEGDSYPQVVRGSEVRIVDELPEGYEVIGNVTSDTVNTTDGTESEWSLYCDVEHRLERRMRREAAQNGGEVLVDFECSYWEEEDTDPYWDDPETFVVETHVTCGAECWADVARNFDR